MTTVTRTQAERRALTQAKILDATIETLVEVGYAGASTPAICRRAGVSQGSLFRYWPTKGELLADAAAHLLSRVSEAYEQAFSGRRISLREALEALWVSYRQPDLLAALELYVAARTDPDLAAALARIELPHRANLQRIAGQILDPELVAQPDFSSRVELVLAAVQGASVGTAVRDEHHDLILDLLERLILTT